VSRHRRIALAALFGASACTSAAEPRDPDVAPSSTVAAADGAPLAESTPGAWPAVPHGTTASGATWQTIRHRTVHVHLAVPKGAAIERSSLEYGHPVVRVPVGDSLVEIVFSSGTAPFDPGLAKDPPEIVGMPVERIARTAENTTVLYRKHGTLVVLGWVRGAKCSGEFLRPQDIDEAFDVCASMRVPPPGLWQSRHEDSLGPHPPVPADAFLEAPHGVPVIYTGHYVARVVTGDCPPDAELRDEVVNALELETRDYPHGPVRIGKLSDSADDTTYRTDTLIFATRHDHCCAATILGFFTPPTDAQIDDVARLCDATSWRVPF